MRNPKMYQKPAIGIGIAALVAVLCLTALASDSARIEKPAAVDRVQYAETMADEVFDIQDLADGAEIQRHMFNRMTPPGISWLQPMFPPVVPFDAKNFDSSFLDTLLGEDKNSVAIYPLSLSLDPKTRETLIYNSEGKLIAALPADTTSPVWPEDADPARVTLQLDLLPAEDVEPYLYTEGRIDESAGSSSKSRSSKIGGPSRRSMGGDTNAFGICNIQKLTNGSMRLTLTNWTAAAEVYAYTVLHTASNVTVSNETITLWTPESPSFDGIESEWECVETNLLFTNSVAIWEDSNITSNDRVRFYATVKQGDTDGDDLTDGAEIFQHRTDPDLADTDGDDMWDGWEISFGLDPLDNGATVRNNGAVGDIDGDGYFNVYEYAQGGNPTNAQSIPDAVLFVDAAAGTNGTGTAQNPFNTIQAALDAAGDYDIISLAPGTYSGPGNVNLDYSGKPVMVQGSGGASECIIDCEWTARYGVDLHTDEDNRSVLSGVRICHAERTAILGTGATFPTIQYCQIVSNGAALQSWSGGAWLRNCDISRNASDWAVVAANEDLVMENCILAHNSDTNSWDSVVSFFGARLQINNCTIVDNPLMPIDLWGSTNQIQINNSILWSNAYTLSQCWFGGAVRYSCIQGGFAGVGNISSIPMLTRSMYRLKHTSPCIDAGTAPAMPPADLIDSPRWDDPSRTNAASFFDMGAMEFTDVDSDGMDDVWEAARSVVSPTNDPDSDSLSNLSEYQIGTEPNSADTDGDVLNDGAEITTYSTDPLDPDTDHDCLSDGDEYFGDQTHGDTDGLTTNPLNVDTDGDGYADCPDCPQVGTCKAPDPRPTVWDGSYYTVQLSSASNAVAYGQTVQVSAQVVTTNGGTPLSGKFDLTLAVNGGGLFETNIPVGALVGESFFPGVCHARTDASGLLTASVRATAGGRMVVSATEVGCGVLPALPKNLAAISLPFKGAAWYGGWLRSLETQSVVQISLPDLDAEVNGWSNGTSTGKIEAISFNQITVGKDGYLLLGAQSAATNYAMALTNAPNGFLAPFFAALHWKPESRVYADVVWELEPRFIAEWNHMGLRDDEEADLTFQAQVWLRSGIARFAYFAMENGTNNLADGHAALIGMKFSNNNYFAWTAAVSNGAGVELATTSMPAIVVTCDDSDGDGLGLAEESALGTDPNLWDTDGDGMSDGWESDYSPALDPLDPADANGDVDGDLYANLIEYYRGSDPSSSLSPSPEILDTDHDGMPDDWEVAYGLNTNLASDALLDSDHDWYVNVLEYATGGDPADPTTHGTHPFEPNGGAGVEVYPPIGSSQKSGASGTGGRRGSTGGAAPYGATPASGHNPSGSADKGSVAVAIRQSGSADTATVEIGGQQWSVPSYIGANVTNVFELDRGEAYTLTVTRGTAISPPDDTVSLWWDIVPGECVLLDGDTNSVINHGGDAIGSHSYQAEPIEIVMTRPDEKTTTRYFHNCFDDSIPGVCSVSCIVDINPDTSLVQDFMQNKVQWSIDPISGAALSWQNGGAGLGLGIYDSASDDWREKAFYTVLPADNEQFGEKDVEVTIENLGCSQEGKTKIYFARDAKNHPNTGAGTTPNWYFYWQQGAVGGGLDEFEYGGDSTDLSGKYVSETDKLYIYSAAAIAQAVSHVTHKTNSAMQFTIGVDATGIDSVAAVVLHEKKHKWIYHNWGMLPDTDGDGVPDSEEECAPYYFNKNDRDSYNLGQVIHTNYFRYGDQEFLCRMAEQGYVSDSTKDWASPGKQWTDGITEY